MAQEIYPQSAQSGQQYGQESVQQTGQQLAQQTGQRSVQRPLSQAGTQVQSGVTSQMGSTLERPSIKPYEETMPSEFRVALHDSNALVEVADWCKDKYVAKGPEGATVKRTLEDLRDVAQLNARFITHDSEYGPFVAETFLNVARKSISELQTYQQQDPAVAETVPVVKRAIESTEKLLRSLRQESQIGGQTAISKSRFAQQFQRSQTSQVGQQSAIGQPSQFGQQSQRGQPSQFGQQSQIGQTSQVGQRKYGSTGITR